MGAMKVLIDGSWRTSSSKDTIQKYNPSTGKLMYSFPSCTKDDAAEAIEAAGSSWERWYEIGSQKRAAVLYKARDIISRTRKELERILIEENGKVTKEAKEEVDGVIDQLTYYAEFARKITGNVAEGSTPSRKILQYKVPYGVVLALTPWNFPAAMVARKLAPALLTGNSVVLKPSSDTPGSAEWIVRAFVSAGVPNGVLNMVTGKGSEIGDYLSSHRGVGLVSMTGSTATGQRIMQKASGNMAKLILELGGKAPFMVCKDANLRNAVRAFLWAKYWNAGQSCIAAERLYVHDSIYERFVSAVAKASSRLRVGDPRNSDMGPLINKAALGNVSSFVTSAIESGGRVVTGGKRGRPAASFRSGYFFQPTIIEGAPRNSRLFREEVFGPVIGAERFSTVDELFDMANDSRYGLASYLFTDDYKLMMRASEQVRFGELYVNMPGPEASQGYHTGFRMTGQAGEGSRKGIEEYLKLKNVYLDYSYGELEIETVPKSLASGMG